ncbi:hypothetical protein [Trinickia fusca]|uniref:hypothetical protein n=1 Tax=Trinickia fusca TaxID=2419777 RepID=UPI0015FF39C0|nr:hypothetical protein [Trinickia fusca]
MATPGYRGSAFSRMRCYNKQFATELTVFVPSDDARARAADEVIVFAALPRIDN